MINATAVITLIFKAGDFVKFGFPMAYTITVVAWGVVDWTSGYSAAGTRRRKGKLVDDILEYSS